MNRVPFQDISVLKEDDRIALIGKTVMEEPSSLADKPRIIGFFVDNDEKADRYIKKLKELYPTIRIIDSNHYDSAGTVLVRVAGPLR